MLMFVASHHIFLNDEQRKKLFLGESVEAVGITVPTWYYKGSTSEPSPELFVKYILTNEKEDYPVTANRTGYKINLPQNPNRSHEILNLDDGGKEFLSFRSYGKKKVNKDGDVNVVHHVEISDYENMKSTIAKI